MSKINIRTKDKRCKVATDLYGLFYEDINRAGDGGLYPEMLRNRSFEDSIPPDRCVLSEDGSIFTTPLGWSDQFNNGEGLAKWVKDFESTPIPAWYADNAVMSLDTVDKLNSNRLASLRVDFTANSSIMNIGYNGLPLKKNNTYRFYMFAKAANSPIKLNVSIASDSGSVYDETCFTVSPDGFYRYDCTFSAKENDFDARLVIRSPEASSVSLGFISLMPIDTYKGHGMRKDLMEMLAGINARFLRFPGGCIVEGFTYETAMRFHNTIGPVWERPSHVLMWHYRTTNGLGFHEYLQICEDLNVEPMYVLNCGITCQGREPEFFEGKQLDALLQDALDAVEYAIGDQSSPMGKKRAEAGHPEPFKMKYIEIGNENSGPEYLLRYKMFYDVLKAKYPKIKYISNSHTERNGLPTEIADEHFYNTPEFFAENTHMYDRYDRHGPDIFVGEYAVTTGVETGTLRCALGEAMFLMGIENNQDIVTLTAYAPLFQNVNYTAWYPNLIAFDNHRVFGIPSYHSLSMLGENRGHDVVALSIETNHRYRDVSGLPGIMSSKGGMTFRRAMLNGKPVSISHDIQGKFSKKGEEYTAVSGPSTGGTYLLDGMEGLDKIVWAAMGDKYEEIYQFEIDVKSSADNPITITTWCFKPVSVFRIDETAEDDWNIRGIRRMQWTINGSVSSVSEASYYEKRPLADNVNVSVDIEVFNTYKVATRKDGFDCYINGNLVHQAYIPCYPQLATTATTDCNDIVVKIVNIKGEPDNVEIELDYSVQPDYEVKLLSGDNPDARNTLDNPKAVSPVVKTLAGAAQRFTYQAPAYSLSILKLRKDKE